MSCPVLPGCRSQGATEPEALDNIRFAIQEYVAAITDTVDASEVREVGVPAWWAPTLKAGSV